MKMKSKSLLFMLLAGPFLALIACGGTTTTVDGSDSGAGSAGSGGRAGDPAPANGGGGAGGVTLPPDARNFVDSTGAAPSPDARDAATLRDAAADGVSADVVSADGGGSPTELTWFKSADVHIHASGCTPTGYTTTQILAFMKKGRMNIGSVLIWGGADQSGHSSIERNWKDFLGQMDDPISEPDYILHWDLEISSLPGGEQGHQILLNIADLNVVKDGKPGYPGKLYLLPNYAYIHKQGGVAGFAHANLWPVGSYATSNGIAPNELSFDVALEKVDFLSAEFLAPGFLWLWYQMLDAGFHIAPAGASDNGCANGQEQVGARHTAFGLPRGAPLTYAGFIDSVRRGRTMIRTGIAASNFNASVPDVIDLKVNGALLGSEIVVGESGRTVQVEAQGASAIAGQTLELVVNGAVAKSAKLTAAAQTFAWQVTLTKSSWIAVRTRDAHTAAIFVFVDGCPIRNDATSAGRWVTHLEQWYAAYQGHFGGAAAEVRTKTNEAKAVWDRIAREASGAAKPVCDRVGRD